MDRHQKVLPVKLFSRVLLAILASGLAVETASAARADLKVFKTPAPLYSAPRKALYAIGTAEASDDLITIINGNIYVAFPADKKTIKIENSVKTIAKNLTYVNVNIWSEIPLTQDFSARDPFHTFINATLKKIGYELAGMFPVLLKGTFASVDFRLGPEATPMKFSDKNVSGFIFGFFNRTGETPDFKSTTVLHFVSEDGTRSGFVESFKILARDKVTLFLAK